MQNDFRGVEGITNSLITDAKVNYFTNTCVEGN